MSTLITNIAELHTVDPAARVLRGAALVLEGERIAWLGDAAAAPAADEAYEPAAAPRCRAGWTPTRTWCSRGTAPPSSRPGWQGRRTRPGGSRSPSAPPGRPSDYDLTRLLLGRVAEAVRGGTTYLETKTGYGLDVEKEARSARIASTVADEVTYLGAHLVPAGMDAEEYTDLVCGQMLDRGPALRALGRRLLRTGRVQRGPVPPGAPGLQGRRAGAARARQPARRGPRRAAGGRSSAPPAWTT